MAKKNVKPTRQELIYQAERLHVVVDSLTRIVVAVVHGAVWIVGFYAIFRCVDSLAGKQTDANILVKALADFKANQWFAYLFGGGCAVWAWNERRLRKKTTKRLQSRVTAFEKKLDPRRSSSGLPESGSTRKGDK